MKNLNNSLQYNLIILGAFLLVSCHSQQHQPLFRSAIDIPIRGNGWITDNIKKNESMISDSGLVNWTDNATVIQIYFRTEEIGNINIALRTKVSSGKSKIECTFGETAKQVSLSNRSFDTVYIGTYNIGKKGYQSLKLKGLTKSGKYFAEISDIFVSGKATENKIYFVKEDFYWGRRGPSVHFRYDIPDTVKDIVWFYNEITVPEGNDIPGSYFMANGFTDGYFGIQVNGPDERRILFSVWSPYKTNNPREIPDDYKIQLLKKGEDVHTGEFGNEGSGGQSYKKFMWKAGTTYRFLLKGEPSSNKSTIYTAYFFAPEKGIWELIASFRRPQGSRYLGNLYSFLENFWTETGYLSRRGLYSNQWVCTKEGKWFELTAAKFTADATAKKESRLDYSGGIENGAFYLTNCGFFNDKTEINSVFSRETKGKPPDINLKELK